VGTGARRRILKMTLFVVLIFKEQTLEVADPKWCTRSLDVKTNFKPTETFQYIHFSSCHYLNVKKGFVKGETLRLLRNNSVAQAFENDKHSFTNRLITEVIR